MNSQSILQTARNVLVGKTITPSDRKDLIKVAAAITKRPPGALQKASTMRLAFWARGLKSAI